MDAQPGPLPLLRLLQMADSAFPVGGYAYSHGVEWLVHEGSVSCEADLVPVLDVYVRQVAGRQWFPAALSAMRARTPAEVLRIDDALDASIAAQPERDSGRAMGDRLLATAAPLAGGWTGAFERSVRNGASPGQYAVTFGVLARDFGVGPGVALPALGTGMVNSITQAALRLGVIGQSAAVRLHAGAGPTLSTAVQSVLSRRPSRLFGAWAPGLDVAAALQPTLQFRMFAS